MNNNDILKKVTGIVLSIGQKHFSQVEHKQITKKDDGSFVTQVDLSIDEALNTSLLKAFPHISFISEESQSDTSMIDGLAWCIDPIDGTHNFMNEIPYYSLSVGLLLDGEPVLGVIFDPLSGFILSGGSGLGVFLDEKKYTPEENTSMVVTSARSYSDRDKVKEQAFVNQVFESKSLKYRRFGSCALDLMNLARGRIGGVRVIGNSIWDWSAGYVIAKEAGYNIHHYDESPQDFLVYSQHISDQISVIK